MPFYVTTDEKRELRDIAQVFFRNGHPEEDPEIKDTWSKWRIFFEAFMLSVDARYGNLQHLPFDGGVFDQPYKTTCIMQELQGLYRQHLEDEAKKAKLNAKKRSRH